MIDRELVKDWVPIREPMLCIDGICEIDYGKSVVGYKDVSKDEAWARGHFINEPILPGTLIIETMAQIGAFIFYNEKNPKDMKSYLGQVNSVKFLRKVIPDCRMYIKASLVLKTDKVARIKCDAIVDEEIVARGEVTLLYVEGFDILED